MMHWLRRHATAAGFALTFALAWGALLPALLRSGGVDAHAHASPLALALASVAPGLAALVLTALLEGRAGLRALWGRVADWRAGWKWYAIAYKGPTVAAGAALVVFHLMGGRFPPLSEWDAPLLSTLFLVPLAGLGQETGWRAFLLPRLQGRFGGLGASVVLGVGWGVWRLPFHLLPDESAGAVAAWMLAGAIPLTVLFTWVWNRSGARLLPVILLNASTEAILRYGFGALPDGDLRLLMLWDAVLLVLAALVLWREGPSLGRRPAIPATAIAVLSADPLTETATEVRPDRTAVAVAE
ncbi:MAG: family intrarane metalloprotease [Gemmatimonadetes bacterium]|nr:family intrarane metalloprotease [Gemmatimonadota bacterium]